MRWGEKRNPEKGKADEAEKKYDVAWWGLGFGVWWCGWGVVVWVGWWVVMEVVVGFGVWWW